MKLLLYWFIVDFLADFVSVECRSPSSMSNLFRNRSSTTISPLTEIILQQQFSTTTINSLTLDSTDKSDDESLLFLPISHSTPASVKVIPAIVATVKSTSFDMSLRTNFNSSKVPVKLLTADAIIDSTSPVVINKTVHTTNGSVKYGMNNRDRMSNNVSRLTERLTVSRSANVSHVNMFPKRPLLSPTMSRYLAIAKEKALNNSTPSPGLLIADSPTPTHIIARRHAPLLSLDDFVLDIDNK